MSYTKGPWILSEYEVRHPITLELRKGCEIFCADNNRVVCEIPDYHYHAEDVEYQSADARLITAAPELLEALEAILPYIPNTSAAEGGAARFSENVRAADMVRAAIAKAKGEVIT